MELFYTSERSEWRDYLSRRFETSTEIWFVFPTKASGEKCLPYNDAVEEALCFGWIDGQAGTLDKTHLLRRFTPRRTGSAYSRPNIERLIWLEERGLIHPKVRESVLPIIRAPFVFPADILNRLKADPVAWENYQGFSESYRRIRIAYIDAARKRPEEFEKRLCSFLNKARQGKLIQGYGGVEKYYRSTVGEHMNDPIRKRLTEGNKTYIETADAARRVETAQNGQHPYAIVVCCSDSRVIPEQIFHAAIGDLFVIRVAGNVLDRHQLGSIEYAVGHLHCRHILVLGHTGCGAVHAALTGGGDGFISFITDDILEAVGQERDEAKACCLNVRHAMNRLEREFREHPEAGDAVIEGAVYDIQSGEVRWLD